MCDMTCSDMNVLCCDVYTLRRACAMCTGGCNNVSAGAATQCVGPTMYHMSSALPAHRARVNRSRPAVIDEAADSVCIDPLLLTHVMRSSRHGTAGSVG